MTSNDQPPLDYDAILNALSSDRSKFLPIDYNCIHVKFIRRATMFGCAEYIKTLLTKVWAKFGTASHIHYHEGFSCFLSFGSRVEAEAALYGLNDPVRFKIAAREVVQQGKISSGLLFRDIKAAIQTAKTGTNQTTLGILHPKGITY
jgi:hypothetical protein